MDKDIEKLVIYQSTSPRDLTVYGKCPTCGTMVECGWGLTHKQCPKCGQKLKW